MRNARRTVAVLGALLACIAVAAPSLLATVASQPSSVQLASHSPLRAVAAFHGRDVAPALRRLRTSAVGTHVVTVVPIYFRTAPARAVFDAMAREVAAFYAREVPGLRLVFTYTNTNKVPRDVACEPKGAISYASSHTDVDPSRPYVHVLAWAPECSGAGFGWVRSGNGMMWVGGSSPQLLAHEFGHNLGLSHSNGLACVDRHGRQVTLSDRCTESVYNDPFSVMGNQCDLASSCRLAGPDIAQLTGQAVAIRPRTTSVVTVMAGGSTGPRTAYLKTPLGVVYFDAAHASSPPSMNAVPAGIQVRILTPANDALLRVPDVVSGSGGAASFELCAFDAWTIPGTGMRVVVTSASDTSTTLHFMPLATAGAPPSTPTITSGNRYPFNRPYPLRWGTRTEQGDVLGYVVSRVENGRLTAYRVPARRTVLRLAGVTTASGVDIKVWAVSRDGLPSRPAVIRVSTNPTFIRFTLSGKRLTPFSVDPLSPTFRVRVGASGVLQWVVDSDQTARVTGWNLHVALHDGATFDVPLTATARHWVLPPRVLESIRATAIFAAPYVLVVITPRGIRFDAEVALYPVR